MGIGASVGNSQAGTQATTHYVRKTPADDFARGQTFDVTGQALDSFTSLEPAPARLALPSYRPGQVTTTTYVSPARQWRSPGTTHTSYTTVHQQVSSQVIVIPFGTATPGMTINISTGTPAQRCDVTVQPQDVVVNGLPIHSFRQNVNPPIASVAHSNVVTQLPTIPHGTIPNYPLPCTLCRRVRVQETDLFVPPEEWVRLNCGHPAHQSCYNALCMRDPQCPACKQLMHPVECVTFAP